jgi:hypothetical protein
MRRTLRSPHRLLYAAVPAALILFATGCSKDDGPGKLFEEEGVWSLTQYNVDGDGLTNIDNQVRGDAFLMKFTADRKVVQTAMCGEAETDTPGTSQCKLLVNETAWFCRCFAYAYQGDEMIWREFAAGETPPDVEYTEGGNTPPPGSSAGSTATGGDTDTDGGGGDTGSTGGGADTRIMLGAISGVASTYQFRPLPVSIWGSDGTASSYVMQQKANSIFDAVLDDPDGRPSCQPCI